MDLQFKPVEADDIGELTPYFSLRSNRTCDSVFLDSFLWRDYYKVRYAISEDKAVLWRMTYQGEEYSSIPMCREENLQYYFNQTIRYFNEVLGTKLKIYLADERALEVLKLEPDKFFIEEVPDAADYLYSADALRTLSGKKLHKKKNNLNAFMKEYDGRYVFRSLCCSDRQDVWNFLDCWRTNKGEVPDDELDFEVEGIHEILKNCSILQVRMAGVYIDGKLEAFTVGSYNPVDKMAVIHIEKANPEIRGLYQFINQQFLIHEFPEDMELVNREDDVGLPGLRQAKMSYYPIGFARKYHVTQL